MRTLIAFLAFLVVGCAGAPMTHGIPNFRTVDATAGVYRGGQPSTADSWAYLRGLGVTTVVKLNRDSEGSDAGAAAVGIAVVAVPMPPSDVWQTLDQPPQSDIRRAVAALASGHAFVHCEHGEDRTGLTVGAYRVLVDHWAKSRAHREMLQHGFHTELLGLDDAWEDFSP